MEALGVEVIGRACLKTEKIHKESEIDGYMLYSPTRLHRHLGLLSIFLPHSPLG